MHLHTHTHIHTHTHTHTSGVEGEVEVQGGGCRLAGVHVAHKQEVGSRVVGRRHVVDGVTTGAPIMQLHHPTVDRYRLVFYA